MLKKHFERETKQKIAKTEFPLFHAPSPGFVCILICACFLNSWTHTHIYIYIYIYIEVHVRNIDSVSPCSMQNSCVTTCSGAFLETKPAPEDVVILEFASNKQALCSCCCFYNIPERKAVFFWGGGGRGLGLCDSRRAKIHKLVFHLVAPCGCDFNHRRGGRQPSRPPSHFSVRVGFQWGYKTI